MLRRRTYCADWRSLALSAASVVWRGIEAGSLIDEVGLGSESLQNALAGNGSVLS